jgi:hypothetical protein
MPVTEFDRLAPDQRAAVELVLRQGRSYGELSDMLGMPEETIRARARGGVTALAPDLPAPARAAEIADFLLGQQAEAHAARTRELLLSDPAAQRWAATVAGPLREVPGGERVPALPTGSDEDPRVNGRAYASPRARSSRLGGALLIAATVVVVGAVIAFVLLRGGDEEEPAAEATPTATATPTAGQLQPGDVILQGPSGSQALAVMRLVQTDSNQVAFALVGQEIPPNESGERYSLWFRKQDGSAQLVGDIERRVGENGQLTSSGPSEENLEEFPQWFQDYDEVLVTQDEQGAKEPGRVIVSGALPK